MTGTTRDLHRGFHDPRHGDAGELIRFLEEADRLETYQPIRKAMREALDPRPGMRLLDAGCGVGLETARLARDHPGLQVTGIDRNGELLEIARRRAPQVEWVQADLHELDVEGEFDAVRTERVLIYVEDLDTVVGNLIGALAPGGRLAFYELDYGGTLLAPGPDEEVARRVGEILYASLEQPEAGRRLPDLLTELGLTDVTARPFAFTPSEQVWQRIVKQTVLARSSEPEIVDWLAEQERAAANGEFVVAFTGVLTAATRP